MKKGGSRGRRGGWTLALAVGGLEEAAVSRCLGAPKLEPVRETIGNRYRL